MPVFNGFIPCCNPLTGCSVVRWHESRVAILVPIPQCQDIHPDAQGKVITAQAGAATRSERDSAWDSCG